MKLAESDVLSSFDSFIVSSKNAQNSLKIQVVTSDDCTRLWLSSISHLYRFVSACNCFYVTDSFDRSTRETFQRRSNGRAPRHYSFILIEATRYTYSVVSEATTSFLCSRFLVNEIKRFAYKPTPRVSAPVNSSIEKGVLFQSTDESDSGSREYRRNRKGCTCDFFTRFSNKSGRIATVIWNILLLMNLSSFAS